MSNQGYGGPPGAGGYGQPPGGQPPGGQPPGGGGFGQPPSGGGFGQPPGGQPPGGQPPGGGGFGQPPGGYGVPPAGHGPGGPPGGGDPRAWSPTGVLSEAFERFKEDPAGVFLPLFVATMIQNAPSVVGNVVSNILAGADDGDGTLALIGAGVSALCGVLGFLVGCYLTGGILKFALKVVRQEPYSFGDVFSGGDVFLPILATNIVVGIATFTGFLLCLVPGIIVALGLSMALPLVVDQRLGAIDAAKQSWALTSGHKMNLFVFGLLGVGLAMLGLMACCVGILLVGPVITVAWVAIYTKLVGR